jgi:hypothetical protein
LARLLDIGKHLLGLGFAQGLEDLPGLEFDISKPYRFCCICGALFQTSADRALNIRSSNKALAEASWKRVEWATNHAKKHTVKEHMLFRKSGLSMTPEAAHKLAAFGVLPLSDSAIDAEIQRALYESKPIPTNDSEN